MPGILLATERYEEARQVFLHFSTYEKEGLIPNVIRPTRSIYNTVDASLWFIDALERYVAATNDWEFVRGLLPTIDSIVDHYRRGTGYTRGGKRQVIGVDPADGLVVSPPQATWMDADPSGKGKTIITPRGGKCVEINALWYAALNFVRRAHRQLDAQADTSDLEALAEQVRASFAAVFWNAETGCLRDVAQGDPQGDALRPNQIFAVSHGSDLLSLEQQLQVVESVRSELLTPGGLRTLSPSDPQYIGQYDTSAPVRIKDRAYHQGTVWPWLIGPYCDALSVVSRQQSMTQAEVAHEIEPVIAPLVHFCLESKYKSLPEVFSGDSPYEPGGTTSQAWSVAEVLRVLTDVQAAR